MFNIKEFFNKVMSIFNSYKKSENFDANDFTFNGNWAVTSGQSLDIRKQGRMVFIEGFVSCGSSGFTNIVGYLPSGCEPLYRQRFVIHTNSTNLAELGIETNGQVAIWSNGSTSSLSSVSYGRIFCCYVSAN